MTHFKPSDPVRANMKYLSGSEKDVLSPGFIDVRTSAWSYWVLRSSKTEVSKQSCGDTGKEGGGLIGDCV